MTSYRPKLTSNDQRHEEIVVKNCFMFVANLPLTLCITFGLVFCCCFFSSKSFAYDRCVIRQTFPFLHVSAVLVFRQGTQMADRYATRLKIHSHSFMTVCRVCLVQESTGAADIYFY